MAGNFNTTDDDKQNELDSDSPLAEQLNEEDPPEPEAAAISRMFQRFRKSENALSGKRKKWEVLDMFDRGEQWKNVNLPPWIPKPVTNMIRYVRTIKRANLASAIPKSRFSALDTEYDETFKRVQKAYEHVWEWEKLPRTIRSCIDRMFLQGAAIAYVYEDLTYVGGKYREGQTKGLFQGRIRVKRFPITNFFYDPDAYCLEDCKWIEVTEPGVPLAQIKNTPAYIEYAGKEKLKELKGDYNDREDSSDGTIFDRDSKPGEPGPGITGDETATIHIHFERYFGADGKWHVDETHYLKNTDFFLYRKEDVKPNVYPFAIINDEEEEQELFGSATAWDILENQKIINKTAQTASIIAVLNQNPQRVVSKESGINAQELARTGTLPGKVWTTNGDPKNSIHNVEVPDIPKGLFEMEDRMKADIREFVGINEAYTGQSVGSLTTSTGVNSLIERATIRDKDKMIQIDDFVEQVSHLIVLFILHKWKDERPIAIPAADGTVQRETWKPLTEAEIEELEWLVQCDTYAHAPMTQAAKRQQAMDMMQMQGQFQYSPAIVTPPEYMELMDFFNKDKILARMQEDIKLQQQMAQSQPPKIVPNGEISFSLSSKDPNVVNDTLQQMIQNAVLDQNFNNALAASHMGNGLNVNPQGPQSGAAANNDPNAPATPTGAMAAQAEARGM